MRVVTVEDVSNKTGMELRVLHTVGLGATWYGQWGYVFGRSAFNQNEHEWEKAREAIGSAKLSNLLHDSVGLDLALTDIIHRYRVS